MALARGTARPVPPASFTTRCVLGWLVCLLCAGCSVRFDADRQQCATADDCAAQGFAASTCVEGLCQPLGSDDAAAARPPGSDAAAVDAAMSISPAADGGAQDAAAPLADGQSAGPTADGSTCVGPECPQCVTDDDCVRRGIAGGTCADSVCWAPKPECTADADCVPRGPEYEGGRCLNMTCRPNPRWRCEREEATQSTPMRTLRALVRHSLTLDPMPGLRAVACHKLDLECTAPVAQVTTDAEGDIVINVPGDFAGFLQIQEPGYFPAMYFLPPAFPANGRLQPFPLLPSGLIGDVLALALGTELDPRRGHMMLISEDCSGEALPDVAFKSPQQDANTVQFYVQDLLPAPEAKQTGEAGNGGYLNFPAGTAMITVTRIEKALRLATVSVVVRPGFISVAYIRPEAR